MRFIGCKKLLLENIEKVIDENIDKAESFCDIFSGTTTVAKFFKPRFKIISNDLLSFSYYIQKGTLENSKVPTFNNLKKNTKISNPIDFFNNVQPSELETLDQAKRFFQNNYSPKAKRMYITDSNALRIDYIRNKINEWLQKSYINDSEYYYLVSALIEAVPYISNISGTYGAYNKWWDKRALKKLELKDLEITDNKKNNIAYNEDGNNLIKKINGDILYIDPPYNSRQYLPNYHILETIALYDSPKIKGVTGLREYSDKKSLYCNKANVKKAFEDLIKNASFSHIILSYSNEGLMSVEDIETILKKYGIADSYKMYEIPYRRFKSRKTSSKIELKELIFYIRKNK